MKETTILKFWEVLNDLSLNELASIAKELGLTKQLVAKYGDGFNKQTYQKAIIDLIKSNCLDDRQAFTIANLQHKAKVLKMTHNLLKEIEKW